MSVYTKYTLGIKIANTPIPDPSGFSYTVSALDSDGSRDTGGTLHRNMVATKHNLKLSYDCLDWATVKTILGLLTAESLSVVFPYPEGSTTETGYSGTYYVGDRTVEMIDMSESAWADYRGKLSFDLIEF